MNSPEGAGAAGAGAGGVAGAGAGVHAAAPTASVDNAPTRNAVRRETGVMGTVPAKRAPANGG
ncbi:hypothetical protein GCM10023321_07340 [Pseudonocardia eucalypti]|uniref:Uncharacterized protein n=1 Tax=Pseudonocardia eucalypti TaxID=648755 RepID=A0ABP9PIG3_9PSEU